MISLRPLKNSDKAYLDRWWHDPHVIQTTGRDVTALSSFSKEIYAEFLQAIVDPEVDKHHYIIQLDGKPVGETGLVKRNSDWWETSIVMGEKEASGKGYVSTAVVALLDEARRLAVKKIYVHLKPSNHADIKEYTQAGFSVVCKVDTGAKTGRYLIRMEHLL